MPDWLERYAERLDVTPLSDDEVAELLDLARDVAHGVERRYAPLSTFLAGVLAGRRADDARRSSIVDAARAARTLLPPADDDGTEA